MPTHVYKDKNRCRITEFVINSIDEFGDIIDIPHSETLNEAKTEAEKTFQRIKEGSKEGKAVVLERVVRKYPLHLFRDAVKHTTIETYGDKEALKEGGWIE